jgi:hypothetical protein
MDQALKGEPITIFGDGQRFKHNTCREVGIGGHRAPISRAPGNGAKLTLYATRQA